MTEQPSRLRASELENSGDLGNNPTPNLTMGEVIAARFNRRDLLKGSLAVTAITATLGARAMAANEPKKGSFSFKEIEAGVDQTHHVAEGYDANILLRWGDPLFPRRRNSTPTPRPPKSRSCNSATTPTLSATSRSTERAITGFSSQITNIRTRS